MKALEKDRGRRYESVGALATDVERYLNGEPIDACPPSRAYRIHKAIGRNRTLAAAIVAVMASLLIGLAVAIYASLVAEQRRIDAVRESSRAKTIAQVLYEMLEPADPSMGRDENYTVRE